MKEYEDLLMAEAKLNLLENGGVDGWDWYEASLENINEEYERVEDIINQLVEIESSK